MHDANEILLAVLLKLGKDVEVTSDEIHVARSLLLNSHGNLAHWASLVQERQGYASGDGGAPSLYRLRVAPAAQAKMALLQHEVGLGENRETGEDMSEPKPQNVEEHGEVVKVDAWLTHFYFDGKRRPILYALDAEGKPDYAMPLNEENVNRVETKAERTEAFNKAIARERHHAGLLSRTDGGR